MVQAVVNRLKLGKLIDAFMKARPRLEAVGRVRTGCAASAEDLVQDAWLKLETARLDGTISNPGGYITRVAQHAVADHLRKERRRGEIDAELVDLLWETSDDISPERTLIGRESLVAVRDALDKLPERTRRIFLMNRLEGVPHRKIAQQFGITDEAVYYHIRRALERLAALRDELNG